MAVLLVSALPGMADVDAIKFYSPFKGVYVVQIDKNRCSDCITPYVSDTLETVTSVAEKTGAVIAINGGFFDPVTRMTTSYVVKDRQLVSNPELNRGLMENPVVNGYLSTILNRSEFRILDCPSNNGYMERLFRVAGHNEIDTNCAIIHSLQAGPALLPVLKLEEEAFVVKRDGKIVRQSASALHKAARSAIGITDDSILLVAVSNRSAMTLKKLAKLMEKLGAKEAMALDGGSSTSLYVNLPGQDKFVLTSAKDNAARRVKSVILVKQPY